MIDVSAFVEQQNGHSIAVFGLGLSGLATVRALCKSGGDVIAWDDRDQPRQEATKMGAKIVQLTPYILKKCSALILAPGVPLYFPEPHPVVKMAREVDIEIISDIEVLGRLNHGRKTIGVTGTNGKSTSVSLMHHVLKEAGIDSQLGGNIGTPALALDMPDEKGCFVLEISSYQLDLCPTTAPDISVLLNITPDHIDRHGSEEGYAKSKSQIFNGEGTAVIGQDDEPTRTICSEVIANKTHSVIPVSVTQKIDNGVYVDEHGVIIDHQQEVASLSNIAILQGAHNYQNAACVYAALKAFGLDAETILKGFKTFGGLPHRQFPVRTINGVAYINDSKATNAEATSKALLTFDNIYWILGGQSKEGGLSGLGRYMSRVKHAFLIGECAQDFSSWLEERGVDNTICHTLDKATDMAHAMSQAGRGKPGHGGVVLLSPAAASWDQFKSFEDRGDKFSAYVNGLEG